MTSPPPQSREPRAQSRESSVPFITSSHHQTSSLILPPFQKNHLGQGLRERQMLLLQDPFGEGFWGVSGKPRRFTLQNHRSFVVMLCNKMNRAAALRVLGAQDRLMNPHPIHPLPPVFRK